MNCEEKRKKRLEKHIPSSLQSTDMLYQQRVSPKKVRHAEIVSDLSLYVAVLNQSYTRQHKVVGWGEDAEKSNRVCGLHHVYPTDMDNMDNMHLHGPCEIQPTINMKMPEKMAREIRLREMEKEEKRREELLAREIDEMRECTFQPQTNSYSRLAAAKKASTKPVVVRGLGRHMELQHMIAKKKVRNLGYFACESFVI
jgi:hypothetical protein